MLDRILEGYLKSFSEEFDFDDLDQSELFEHFVNYCIISRLHPEPFELDSVRVGGGQDTGIDGIAILVNDHLISSKREIDFFKDKLRRLDVQFVFIQSKTSSKFDKGEIGTFIFGVRDFFEKTPSLRTNDYINNLRELKEYIYDLSIHMDKSPTCQMYYTAAGKWLSDEDLIGRINLDTSVLKQTQLFSDVNFIPIDAEKIKNIYLSLKRKVIKEILFDKHTILPKILNVQEAYIGILPCIEYLKLICDEEEYLQRFLFYDNIRDFQGNNPVNQEIRDTINDASQNDKFILLNNGITIVAKAINKVGASFKIIDYQIVNGCQTSHVLYLNRRFLTPNVYLPIKLIVTNDNEVTNQIIKATNRQTEVKIEAFEALSPFHKKLEEYYTTFDKEKDQRLYYERRSKQYDALPIKPEHIITIAGQVNCFMAMFINEPHSTHRYYGELLKSNKSKIFLEDHSLYPYYISGYGLYLLDQFFKQKKLNTNFKRFRYHLLMMFRLLVEKNEIPPLNSKKVDAYCIQMQSTLWDRKRSLEIFEEAISILNAVLGRISYDYREAARRRAFTLELIDLIGNKSGKKKISTATVDREIGDVKTFSDIKGYGFIENESESSIFFHINDVRNHFILKEGDRVEFNLLRTEKGPKALDVELI